MLDYDVLINVLESDIAPLVSILTKRGYSCMVDYLYQNPNEEPTYVLKALYLSNYTGPILFDYASGYQKIEEEQ